MRSLGRLTAVLVLLLASFPLAASTQAQTPTPRPMPTPTPTPVQAPAASPAQDTEFALATAAPQEGSFLTAAPTQVRLTLSSRILLDGSSVSVIAPGGGEVNNGPVRLEGDGRTLVATLRPDLPNGLYTVNWAAAPNGPGEKAEGSFDFGLRVGATLPTLRADRTRAAPGEAVTLTGTAFKPNGAVVTSISLDDEFVEAGRADDVGRVQQTIRIPDDVPSGAQTITMADGDGASATTNVEVFNSAASPIRVRMAATSRPENITVDLTVLNRSGFDLMLDTIRVPVPQGATFLRATTGGRLVGASEVGWDNFRIRPGETVGPLSVTFDTRALPDATSLTIPGAVHFIHPAENTPATAQLMRFQNTMPGEVSVRVGGLD
jgi:methionine-rich copper-binding protein CopC